MSYVEQNMVPGETLLYQTRHHWIVLIGPLLVALLWGLSGLFLVWAGMGGRPGMNQYEKEVRGGPPAVVGAVARRPGPYAAAASGTRLPGACEDPVAAVSIDGRLGRTLRGDGRVAVCLNILEDYVTLRFPAPAESAPAWAMPLRRPRSRVYTLVN